MENTTTTLGERIAAISAEIGTIKKKKDPSSSVSYAFRGIDEAMDALSPLISKYQVSLQSEVLHHSVQGRSYKKWDNYKKEEVDKFAYMATVVVRVKFTHGNEVEVWEEPAMSEDHSDKAFTQAMSMAYKYAILRKFCVRTSDMKDPDAIVPDGFQGEKPQTPQPKAKETLVEGTDNHKKVVAALTEGKAKVSDVEKKYTLTPEMKTNLLTLEKK